MKKLILVTLLSCAGFAHAQTASSTPASAAKKELVQKVLTLQQPGVENLARSFGPPAATVECAAPLLRVGGVLVVSEPPDGTGDRWSTEGLARLGLVLEETRMVDGATFSRLRQVEAAPPQFPRRPGVPVRRPLF